MATEAQKRARDKWNAKNKDRYRRASRKSACKAFLRDEMREDEASDYQAVIAKRLEDLALQSAQEVGED